MLITNWFQQFPSHSIGSLVFGPDGSLYASGGDGASFTYVDYGQTASTPSSTPWNDPANQGGALRSQDLRCRQRSGDVGRHDHPHRSGDRRRAAEQPARTCRATRTPDASSLRPAQSAPLHLPPWHLASSGSATSAGTRWEEINRIVNPLDGSVETSAGPATRAMAQQPGYAANGLLTICQGLYGAGPVPSSAPTTPTTTPIRSWMAKPVPRRPRRRLFLGHGLAFYPTSGGTYPSTITARCSSATTPASASGRCSPGGGGLPDPDDIVTISTDNGGPVNLISGPNGDIFYPGFDDGRLHRIELLRRQPAADGGDPGQPDQRDDAAPRQFRRRPVDAIPKACR